MKHFASGLSALAIALVAVALATGCTSEGQREPSGTPSKPQAQTQTRTRQGTPATYRQRPKPKPWYRQGLRTVGFQSPTGNIRCALDSDDETQLLCKTLNNGKAIDLDSVLEPDKNITATIPAEPTLAYGRVWSSPHFFCWSRFTGVTCRSLYSTYGFAINRSGITFLKWDNVVLGGGGSYSSGGGSYSPNDSSSGSGTDTSGGGDCDPNYEGACVPTGYGDVNCADVYETDFYVVGADIYSLDGDGDGVACES
jgi:hypothetical protein